jgi:hypothetical protein
MRHTALPISHFFLIFLTSPSKPLTRDASGETMMTCRLCNLQHP